MRGGRRTASGAQLLEVKPLLETFTDFCRKGKKKQEKERKNARREKKPFLQLPPCSTFQPIRTEATRDLTVGGKERACD